MFPLSIGEHFIGYAFHIARKKNWDGLAGRARRAFTRRVDRIDEWTASTGFHSTRSCLTAAGLGSSQRFDSHQLGRRDAYSATPPSRRIASSINLWSNAGGLGESYVPAIANALGGPLSAD